MDGGTEPVGGVEHVDGVERIAGTEPMGGMRCQTHETWCLRHTLRAIL